MARCRGEITLKCEIEQNKANETNKTTLEQNRKTEKNLRLVQGIFKALFYGLIFSILIRAFAPADAFPLVPGSETTELESSGDNTLELSQLLVPIHVDDLKNVKSILKTCRAQYNRVKKDRLERKGRKIWRSIKGMFEITFEVF